MELKLEYDELEPILLDWANTHFPGQFNAVTVDAGYSTIRSVKFFLEKPPAPTPLQVA